MKRILKVFFALTLATILIFSFSCISASAAGSTSIAFSSSSPKVGDSVTVTVKLNAGEAVYAIDGSVTYDSAVLQYVSGADSASGSTLRIVKDANGESTLSYSISFKTIKEGTTSVKFSANYVGESLTSIAASGSSANLTVKNPVASVAPPPVSKPQAPAAPSSNCNLSSLSVDGGTLTPAFSPNVTEYSVTVENSVSSTVVHYNRAHSGATVSGGGTVALEIGDNAHAVTVTAQDGTKKTYNIKIRRATIEETVALNPFATVIGGKMHHIVNDLTGIEVPAGFVAATESYNGQEIPVFKSDNSEYDYTLFRISRDEDGYTDYYIYKSMRDEFVPLQYMIVNNIMYVFAELPETYIVPEGYYETATTLGNGTVKAFCAEKEALADLYVVYCYTAGNEGFYRFDALQSTVQRAPDFSVNPPEEPVEETGIMGFISSLTRLEKILILALAVSVIVIIILIIVLCVKGRRSRHGYNDPLDDDDMVDFFQTANMMSATTAEETENE